MSRTIELALKHFGETHMANAAFREKVEAFRNSVLAEAAEEKACAQAILQLQTKEGGT